MVGCWCGRGVVVVCGAGSRAPGLLAGGPPAAKCAASPPWLPASKPPPKPAPPEVAIVVTDGCTGWPHQLPSGARCVIAALTQRDVLHEVPGWMQAIDISSGLRDDYIVCGDPRCDGWSTRRSSIRAEAPRFAAPAAEMVRRAAVAVCVGSGPLRVGGYVGVDPQAGSERDLEPVDAGQVAPGLALQQVEHRLGAEVGLLGDRSDRCF